MYVQNREDSDLFLTQNATTRLSIKSSEAVFNDGSNDYNFRVESNADSHMLFIDAGENAIGIGDTAPRDSSWGNATDTRQVSIEANAFAVLHLKATDTTTRWGMGAGVGKLFAAYDDVNAIHHLIHSTGESVFNEDSHDIDFRVESDGNANMLAVDGGNNLTSFGKFGGNSTNYGGYFSASGSGFFHQVLTNTTSSSTQANLFINRQGSDGQLIQFRQADTQEGSISVSGSTVSYNGFSGRHESSGIPTNTPIGTVVSTIDELDLYPDTTVDLEGNTVAHNKAGQTRADHAKVEVSGSEGDPCVYGVVSEFDGDGKLIVTSVGIGSIRVTGACVKGDLLESNGDGTAKVQSDDIIRSKTIGKVTIGNSNTGVKLVSCVLYCG